MIENNNQTTDYKYILLHSDGQFERVYPKNLKDKKNIINADRISIIGNSTHDLVFIFNELMFGLQLNIVATQLAQTNLYGSVLIEDREHKFKHLLN